MLFFVVIVLANDTPIMDETANLTEKDKKAKEFLNDIRMAIIEKRLNTLFGILSLTWDPVWFFNF